jgi:hypothetical protein
MERIFFNLNMIVCILLIVTLRGMLLKSQRILGWYEVGGDFFEQWSVDD